MPPDNNNDLTTRCPECGETMRLVGVERDAEEAARHVLTFECPRGHYYAATYPQGH